MREEEKIRKAERNHKTAPANNRSNKEQSEINKGKEMNERNIRDKERDRATEQKKASHGAAERSKIKRK